MLNSWPCGLLCDWFCGAAKINIARTQSLGNYPLVSNATDHTMRAAEHHTYPGTGDLARSQDFEEWMGFGGEQDEEQSPTSKCTCGWIGDDGELVVSDETDYGCPQCGEETAEC